METKKLRSIIFACILTFFAFANTIKAVTYFYCGVGSITTLSSWWTTAACTGTHPANFTHASDVWNFNTAGSYTLTGTWTLGSAAVINVGFGGTAVTLLTNTQTIKTAGPSNITLNVLGSATLNVGTSNLFVAGNKLTLNASAAGSTVIYSVAGATIANVTYSNLNFTANNTLNISTVTSFTNSATATVNSALLTIGSVVNTGTIIMGAGGTNLAISTDLNNTGSLSLVSSSNLTVNGTITSLGTISGDGTGYLINAGTSLATLNMDQTTAGTSNAMLEVQNTGSGSITLGSALCISAGGDVTPVSGTINVGNNFLTLLAAQGQSGAIGDCSGGTFSATSIISQAYHNPNGNSTNWTTMGVAGVTNANFQQWHAAFPITCASCIDGSLAGGSPFTSITSYDETQTGGGDYSNAAHYINLSSDANTINNGQGYWVFMGNSSPGSGTGPELITVTGAPQQGSVPLNFTFTNASNGSNLLANPFPSPISWSTVMANNPGATTDGVCYIYNALDGSYGTIDASGLASSSYGLNDDVIPAGMAFYIQATASGTLTFDETVKSVGGTQDLQRLSSNHLKTQSISQIPRFSIQAVGTNMQSRTMFAFDSRADIGIDHTLDAPYLIGSEPLRISSIVSGKDFSINGLPDLNQNYNIPVKMIVAATGSYQISAINLQNMASGACLILRDNYTNTNYDLHQGPYNITLNDTETVARFVLKITIASLSITANATQATCPASTDGYIVAVGNSVGPWNYTWKNSNNTIVKTSTNKSSADTLTGLNSGVYSVDVNTVGSCDNATQSFTLTVPGLMPLALTANSTQATCSTANDGYITVIGNNAGPWNYTWKDANNNIIQTTTNNTNADTLNTLNSGVYTVEVSTVGGCDDAIQSFTLAAPAAPTSAFSTSSPTVNVGTVVTFTNNSTNAGNYWWTFGDGSTSNLQTPNYAYNTLNTYTVTLYAFNASCNDTVSSQQVITVQATTGIASIANGDMTVSKDQSGAFIKFNYSAQTRVNINVYNALGQLILANNNVSVSNDKIYINPDNAKDQMIFISISNLDKNTMITKKLFNN